MYELYNLPSVWSPCVMCVMCIIIYFFFLCFLVVEKSLKQKTQLIITTFTWMGGMWADAGKSELREHGPHNSF